MTTSEVWAHDKVFVHWLRETVFTSWQPGEWGKLIQYATGNGDITYAGPNQNAWQLYRAWCAGRDFTLDTRGGR